MSILCLLMAAVATTVVTAVATTSPTAARTPRYQEYVALGDSWSADSVLIDLNGVPDTTYTPIDCAQSRSNYPKLVAASLGVTRFADATCGSATTDHLWGPQTVPLGGVNPPQFDRLTPTTDLVTLGIGTNDAGVVGAAMACLTPVIDPVLIGGVKLQPSCKDRLTAGGVDQLAEGVKATGPKLIAALGEIRRRSPQARILVVDYLAGLPARGCWPTVPIWDEDMIYLHRAMLKVNAMIRRAARVTGNEYVNTYTSSVGHDICTDPTVRYVEGIGLSVNAPGLTVPIHPNQAGADAQAVVVLARIRG
jgi:hypothetical protein